MRLFLIATLALLTAAPALAAPVQPTLTTDSGLTYSAWLPKDFSRHHHDVPLLLFSHGFGGCAQQSRTLTQALADAGYAVLAPNHKDKGCKLYTTGAAPTNPLAMTPPGTQAPKSAGTTTWNICWISPSAMRLTKTRSIPPASA